VVTGRWHEQRAGVTGEELLAALVVILAIVPLVYGAAMDVIDGVPPADADRVLTRGASVVVLVEPDSGVALTAAARWLGADPELAESLHRQRHRRPSAHVEDRHIAAVVLAIRDVGRPAELHLHVGERGLLVVAPPELNDLVRRSVAPLEGGPEDAFAALILAVALHSEETIEQLTEVALGLDETPSRLAAGAQRREISGVRARLYALQHLWKAHQQVLAPDEPLADEVPDGPRRVLRRARGVFKASGTTAAELYALLGDTLSRQAAMINERLTLAAVVFFPLTVSTGFFGMNFEWMVSHIGSVTAFVVLGIMVPFILVGVTLVGAHWLTRE
jgi:Mg2+ and Co2+ transporter CorA